LEHNRHLDFGLVLERAGVTVRYLDGWDEPNVFRGNPYLYREPDGNAAGSMHHHTATTEYTPNRDKANAYAGLSVDGSERLYQGGVGLGSTVPVYVIANAYPAPISSGTGDINVLEKVRQGIRVVGRQGPDSILSSGDYWYGNAHYWNTEWVLDGVGAEIDPEVWDMMVVVSQVQNDLNGWTDAMHICHYHHTGRKIDLYGGQFEDADETIQQLREQMNMALSLERWATRLRHPSRDNTGADDFQRMVDVGIITQSEYNYWTTVSTDSSEMGDLRDAVTVRSEFWGNTSPQNV